MVDVEEAWLSAWSTPASRPPGSPSPTCAGLVGPTTPGGSPPRRSGGNPAIALVVAVARPAAGRPRGGSLAAPRADQPGRRRHRADARAPATPWTRPRCAAGAGRALADLAGEHRPRRWWRGRSPSTRCRHVRPEGAGWLTGVLDAYDDLAPCACPVQVGGAAGTMAGPVELGAGSPDPVGSATGDGPAGSGWAPAPWHTTRTPRDPARRRGVRCTDAWGRIASDVLVLGRPEIGELVRGLRRRIVDDAAQGQPGALHAAAPRGPGGPGSRRPCTSRRPSQVDERPTGPGTPSGRPCGLLLRRTSSPVPRRPTCSPVSRCTRTGWRRTLQAARARPSPSSAAWPSWPTVRPATTTSARHRGLRGGAPAPGGRRPE